jgi:hypothetical protein
MWQKLRLVMVAAFAAAFSGPLAYADGPTENVRDLVQLVDRSNLIFLGEAQKVMYRNAQADEGEGLIPYTIVTYSIEKVLRGKPPGKKITMRFVGGPDGRGRFLTPTGVPLIREGDRDVLFVASTDDPSCPLVFCEDGRYRVSNKRVFDNAGTPVIAVNEDIDGGVMTIISGGTPLKEFQTVRFPSPPFDELIRNPEVAAQLKSLKMPEEEARRRYELEAPRVIELKQELPINETPTDAGPSGAGLPPGDSATISASEALPLNEFIAITELVSQRSKRTPIKLRSIDPAARIVPARPTVAAPQRVEPPLPSEPLTREDAAEFKAFEKNDGNPVIRKSR